MSGELTVRLEVATLATGSLEAVQDPWLNSDGRVGFGWPADRDELVAELRLATGVQVVLPPGRGQLRGGGHQGRAGSRRPDRGLVAGSRIGHAGSGWLTLVMKSCSTALNCPGASIHGRWPAAGRMTRRASGSAAASECMRRADADRLRPE